MVTKDTTKQSKRSDEKKADLKEKLNQSEDKLLLLKEDVKQFTQDLYDGKHPYLSPYGVAKSILNTILLLEKK